MPRPNPHGAPVQQFVIASAEAPEPRPGYGFHVGVTYLQPGSCTDDIRHEASEAVLVTAGEFVVELDGDRSTVCDGENFVIPPGVWHRFTNAGHATSSMIYVFGGRPEPITEVRDNSHTDDAKLSIGQSNVGPEA